MAMIFGASPRVSVSHVTKFKHRGRDKASDVHDKHWSIHRDQVISRNYQSAHSDAMQLYSIGAGQLVMVQNTGQVWDYEYELSAMRTKGNGGKRNKFVTETISYGKLKIRSEENKMYICAKSSGHIVFKNKAERNKRPRRRCLFKWSFTEEKHIQLSLSSGGKDWFLAVQDGIVRLQPIDRCTEKERSFIWLPTRSANSRPLKHRKRYPRPGGYPLGRGFPLVKPGSELKDCESLQKQVDKQRHLIQTLSREQDKLVEENKKLLAELKKLKKEKTNMSELTNVNKTQLTSTVNPR